MKKNIAYFFYGVFLLLVINNGIASQSFTKLTILTAPIGYSVNQSGGPSCVTRSLLHGLKKLDISFNYNPSTVGEVGDCVYVLADSNALRQAIDLKRRGIIKKLVAGPNIMTRANECDHILACPEIDTYIVNSQWTYSAYLEDEPSLHNRLQIWPAGVDCDDWVPVMSLEQKILHNKKQILVYWKTESRQFCKQVEDTIKKTGFQPIRIQYGHYHKDHFKQLLDSVLCAVFISRSESQGIALAESWAMDVPTLVWDPQEPVIMAGKSFWPISAAPYLNVSNGLFWKNIQELEQLLYDLNNHVKLLCPRAWVLRNGTDELCAHYLLDIINTAPCTLISRVLI